MLNRRFFLKLFAALPFLGRKEVKAGIDFASGPDQSVVTYFQDGKVVEPPEWTHDWTGGSKYWPGSGCLYAVKEGVSLQPILLPVRRCNVYTGVIEYCVCTEIVMGEDGRHRGTFVMGRETNELKTVRQKIGEHLVFVRGEPHPHAITCAGWVWG